jgi:hypothetical protein
MSWLTRRLQVGACLDVEVVAHRASPLSPQGTVLPSAKEVSLEKGILMFS